MHGYIALATTGIAASTGGLYGLNTSDTVFRVKHALTDFGFKILSSDSLSPDCVAGLGYSFYSINQKEFLDARQKCVKPVKFYELAKGQGLIPINPGSLDIKNDNQPDWVWAATIYDQTTTAVRSDISPYIKLSNSETSKEKSETESKQELIKQKLNTELEQFSDESQKTEFTKNLANLLIILDYIDELKYVCGGLQDTHHNSGHAELTEDWAFYVRYCTKFSVD